MLEPPLCDYQSTLKPTIISSIPFVFAKVFSYCMIFVYSAFYNSVITCHSFLIGYRKGVTSIYFRGVTFSEHRDFLTNEMNSIPLLHWIPFVSFSFFVSTILFHIFSAKPKCSRLGFFFQIVAKSHRIESHQIKSHRIKSHRLFDSSVSLIFHSRNDSKLFVSVYKVRPIHPFIYSLMDCIVFILLDTFR